MASLGAGVALAALALARALGRLAVALARAVVARAVDVVVVAGVQETPRNVDVFGLWRPLSRSHRCWLLPWDRLIISARVLEIWTHDLLASTRTKSC